MNITIENILLIGSLLLLVSVIAGKTSYRFGVPTLLLFLVVGMLAGSEGLGGIYFNDPQIAQFIGIVSLNFILFSGGLDTSWEAIKPVLKIGLSLSTVGVLLTAMTLGTFVYLITDFSLMEGMLLGAIVSSTDAAAVFSILRAKSLGLKKNLRPTLELESGSNDPMAYVLVIAFLSLVMNPELSAWTIVPFFLQQMILGALGGLVMGRFAKYLVNRIRLDFEGLYPVLVIAVMFLTFSATDFLGGNGFLAVYICAVYLGNHRIMHKRTILKVFDGLAWLMQIVLFLTLGLLVYPSHILPVIGVGLLISAFLIFVARPIGVFISLLPFEMKLRRRFYISWVGLRGAVPIVFATYPLIAGANQADMIFNIVFFVAITSVMIQGTTLSIMAKWLHVAVPEKAKARGPLEVLFSDKEKSAMMQIEIAESSSVIGKEIVALDMPESCVIVMIQRDEKYITPSGQTVLEAGDKLIILGDNEKMEDQIHRCLES
jgi:potassium/hydrogen antiporter